MNIKILRSFAVGLIIAIFAMAQYGCEQEWQQEYESSELEAPASATLSVTNIEDSTAVIEYTQSAIGQLYVVVVPGDDETTAPEGNSLLKLTVEDAILAEQLFLEEEEELSGTITVGALLPNTSYKVFALPVNTDGVFGEIATTDAFATSDEVAPSIAGADPAPSVAPAQPMDLSVTVVFDEPVVVDNEDDIYFRYLDIETLEFTDVPAEVTTDGTNLIAEQTQEPLPGQYVCLSLGENAITDRSNNAFEGLASGLNEEYEFVGLYWRTEFVSDTITNILPDTEIPVEDENFVIELTYGDFAMELNEEYSSNDIVVRYISANATIDVKVPAENIVITGEVVTIVPPRTPIQGETITFQIAEGAYNNVYGNPCEAVEFDEYSWLLVYGYERDLIIGDYVVDCVSDFSGDPYTFNVTITADTESDNGVIITGLEDSTEPVNGIFNGDLATLTIPPFQSLGDLLGDGSDVQTLDFNGEGTDIVGTIQENGNMTVDWASFIVGGEYDGYFYDAYAGSTWTKGAAPKAASQERTFAPLKRVK